MISIRQSLKDIDQREEHERQLLDQQRLILSCYSSAIQSTREYAVEIDRDLTAKFRARLLGLEKDLVYASLPQDFEALQASFRGELRLYRDRGQALIARLRDEAAASASAMQALSEAVSAHGAGYQEELNQELGKLEAVAESDDLPTIRSTIYQASASIQHSFEQMQRSNQMAIAQLLDEIRGLHKAMDTERRALLTDRATGAWNRQKLSERIEDLLKRDESFGLLLVSIMNWKSLAREIPPDVADRGLQALAARLTEKFGAEGLVGRWSEDMLAVIVETDAATACKMTAGMEQELANVGCSGSAPPSRNPALDLKVRCALINRASGSDATDFFPRVGQQVSALTE